MALRLGKPLSPLLWAIVLICLYAQSKTRKMMKNDAEGKTQDVSTAVRVGHSKHFRKLIEHPNHRYSIRDTAGGRGADVNRSASVLQHEFAALKSLSRLLVDCQHRN